MQKVIRNSPQCFMSCMTLCTKMASWDVGASSSSQEATGPLSCVEAGEKCRINIEKQILCWELLT
jgi:hypothetical protein